MNPSPKKQHLICPNPKKGFRDFFRRGAGFHQLNYYEWGTGDKVVFCVHGLTRNARDFDYLACDLANHGFRVICPDVVGRGKSGWLSNPAFYGYPLYVADMIFLMTQLGLKDVLWVGTSMGGLIGMMLEAGTPHMIKRMVLNDIGPFMNKEALQRIGSYVGNNMSFPNRAEAEKYLKEVVLKPFGIKKQEHWDHMLANSFNVKEDGSHTLSYDPNIGMAFWNKRGKLRKMFDINLWPMWENINCPMLVLRGEESDLLSRDTAKRMAEKPETKLIELPGVGHAPSLLEEEQISLVRDWLLQA